MSFLVVPSTRWASRSAGNTTRASHIHTKHGLQPFEPSPRMPPEFLSRVLGNLNLDGNTPLCDQLRDCMLMTISVFLYLPLTQHIHFPNSVSLIYYCDNTVMCPPIGIVSVGCLQDNQPFHGSNNRLVCPTVLAARSPRWGCQWPQLLIADGCLLSILPCQRALVSSYIAIDPNQIVLLWNPSPNSIISLTYHLSLLSHWG